MTQIAPQPAHDQHVELVSREEREKNLIKSVEFDFFTNCIDGHSPNDTFTSTTTHNKMDNENREKKNWNVQLSNTT